MRKEEELFNKIKDVSNKMKSLDDEHNKLEEEYFYLKQELDSLDEEQTCDCDNCACSDECDGEYEKLIDCNIKDELGILIEEDDGEIYITLQDLDNGDIITITEEQLHVIVKLFNCACE